MFKRILIGVDGGLGGLDAIRLARELAVPDTVLVLAHIWENGAGIVAAALGTPHPAPVAERMLGASRAAAGLHCAIAVRPARSAAAGLHELAADLDCDLLVLGSRAGVHAGRAGLSSHVRKSLHGAPSALAIAPRGYAAASGGLLEIGVAYEQTPVGEGALARARLLAAQLGGRLQLLSVVAPLPLLWMSPPVAQLAQLDEITHDRVADVRSRLTRIEECDVTVVRGEPVARLREFSERVDLLVLGSRSYGPVHRVLFGSTSDGLLQDAACAVLVLAQPGTRRDQAGDGSAAVGCAG